MLAVRLGTHMARLAAENDGLEHSVFFLLRGQFALSGAVLSYKRRPFCFLHSTLHLAH